MQVLAATQHPSEAAIFLAGVSVLGILYTLFLLSGSRQTARQLRHMHLNARPTVATISGWSWDRGEDGDNLHVAMVRFTTDDGREFDDVEVSSIRADRPGPLGGQLDIFYDPDMPSWVATTRPTAATGRIPRGTIALSCAAIGLCLWFIAVAVAGMAGLDIPSPFAVLRGLRDVR